MSSLEEFRKKRKDRGTDNASVSADLESFRAIRNQRLKAPTYQSNYYSMPSSASVTSTQPSTEPKQEYRYNSIAEYDEALKRAEEGINKGAYNWKNVANAMINSPLSQASSIAKAAATQKYTEAEREYEALKKERNLYKNEHILEEMQNKYANNADFASLSGDLTQDEINSLGNREAVSFFESNTRKMKPEEKAIANYIFRTEGTEGLKRYFGEIMPSVNKRSHEARMEEQSEWLDEGVNTNQIENALGPVLGKAVSYAVNKDNFYRNAAASLGTTPANIIGGVGAIGEFIDSKAHGRDYDPYSGAAGLASWAEDTREDVSENITDATGSQYVLPFLYNTGMSVLDSTAGALTMGNAYSVLMGGTAFNSTYRDVVDRGGSESDAIGTALAAGIFEGLFEKVSLDNVLKAKDVTGWKSWIKETLKQGGIEASEEVATEIANIFTDQLINGINSDVQIKIDELRDQGYSETEVASMVAKDLAMQIGEAGLGGFVSGLMMGGAFNSMQYHQLSNMGDYVDRNKLSGIDFSDNENAQSLSKKYGDEWASKAKSAEIGATYREQLSKSEKGLEKAELDSATDAIAKTYDISQKEAAEFAKAVMTDEVDRTLKQRNMLKTDLGDDILDDYQNNRGWYGFDENGRLKNDFSKASNAFEQYSKVVNARKSDAQVSAEKASKALKVGQTNLVNGEEADIISMSQNKDGSYTVKTSKGNYKASDVTVDERTATALSWSANIANEALKEAYVKNFSGGDINDYDMYARFLFEWGKMGADWSMYYDNVTSVMSKEKAEQLYNAGMEFDKKDLKFTQAAFDIAVAEMKSSKTKKGDFAGGTYENGNFTKDDDFYRNLSRTKKRLYLICKAFADFAGINVQVINDEDVASENGHFVVDRPDGGTVMINLAARPYSDSAYGMHSYVIDTLSHELTHWMRANNEEGYNILEKAISDHLKSKGVYDDLIKNEIESHKKAHPGEKELDEFDALEEVIARGCEDMLEDSKTMREVLSTLDVNSLEKLRIAFDKWFDRVETFLDKLMSGFESPNEVIKYLRDEYKTFRKLWVEGIQGAIKNAQTEKVNEKNKTMHLLKGNFARTAEDRENYAKFAAEVDLHLANKHPNYRQLKVMEHTPILLQKIGLADKPIYMTKAHYNDITHDESPKNPHWHGLKHEEVKQAPVLLNNAAIIIDSSTQNTSIVVVSASLDYKQRPIIMSLQTDGEAYDLGWNDSNFMTSMYGRDDFIEWIKNSVNNNEVLYLSKKNSQALESNLRLQLPLTLKVLGYDHIIHQSQNAVKTMKHPKQMNSDKLSVKQEITSEDTSLNQTPATFTNFRFRSTDRILDYGGGRYDTAKRAMEQMYPGIKFEVVDEFNRTSEHNKRILDEYSKDKADVLTVNNVLNVIKEADIREDVIRESKRYLKSNGTAYFAIYEGNGSAEGGETSKGWQNNAKAEWYVPAIEKYYKNVKRVGSFILASDGAINYSRLDSEGKAQIQDYTKSLKGENLDMKQVKYSTKLADERQQNSLNKVVNKVGIEVQDSYAYPKYSDKTWRASEYVTNKTAAIKALAKSMDITEKEAEQYIDDIGSIANQIANDPDRLDYISIEGKSAWVSNPEYGGSLDYSFLCPKRLTYTGTMNAILAKQNDLIFSVDDFLFLRRALISAGYEAPCSFCFVESARARFGKYNQQFLDLAKEEKLAYIPTAEELSNPDKLEEMRSAHPETFKRYEKFLNSLSQRKPKMLEERRPYNGDILKAFQGKEHTIIEKNLHGGIRFNSFSDFETVHMIDCMQAIMDMSRVGLAGFGYTKQKAFAEIFGKTGLKIDMSCVAKGVMQDGKHIIFDDVEGMNHKDALKLRNGNVGIVCVVFTDDQLRAALCDERIDYVLPFHRSQWSKKDYEKMGLSLDTKDFTRLQTEKFGTKRAKEGNIPFLSYWNENQTGEETVQRYLDIINEQNKTPIFPFILEKDEKGNWIMPKGKRDHNGKFLNKKEEIKELAAKNYWKLLTEYKMYDNDGTPIGQYPVKPIFDMDAAHKLLKKYDGSHKEFPVSKEVVEDFMNYKKTGESKLLPEWKKYSDKLDSTYMEAVKSGNLTLAQQMVDQAAKEAGYTIKGYHGTENYGFTEFDPNKSDDRISLFFSSSKGMANTYVGDESKIYDAYLKITNPYVVDAHGSKWNEIYLDEDINALPEDVRAIFEFGNYIHNNIDSEVGYTDVFEGDCEESARFMINEAEENGYPFSKDEKEKFIRLAKKADEAINSWNEDDHLDEEGEPQSFKDYIWDHKISQTSTRKLAKYAKDNGYDGLIVKNVMDNGKHYSDIGVMYANDVFVVFNSNQVKSADPITYDDNGNVIPLSERFNANDNDIRYSEKLDLTNASPEVRERVKELEKQVGKLTKENDALKAAKAMAAEKAQKEALANKITEQSKTLSKWLLTDPKANPVPQVLRKPIINLLRSIDYTTSSFAWRKAHEFEYTKKDQSMAVMMGRLNHMLNEINQDEVNDSEAYDLSQLDWLPAFTKEFDQITNAINEAEKTSGERFVLQQMSVEDLEKLNKLITALKTSVHNMNKVFGEHNKESVSDLGKEIITYLDEVGQKNVDNALTQFLEMDNTTPYYFFKRMGPAGQKLFRTLMDAQGNYAFKAKEIETYAKSVFKGKDVNKWREQIKEFDITEVKYGGKEVAEPEKTHIKMTVPQIMSLYCLAKRDQALKHLSSGGMKISTFKEGKNDVRQLNNVTLSESDLNMITSTLTDEQREVADKLQDFLSTTCSTWGNEITMQRFGYKAYTEKNYFPIVVDTNVLNKEPRQKGSSLYQLLNMGFTKPLNPKAKNPIEIFDIFEVFTTHATDMAQYNTFALPILNVIRVWNYKEIETLESADEGDWSATRENTERDTGEADEIEKQKYITVKASIEKTLGAKGNRYIGRLLADLNGDVTGGRADRLDKFTKNYKTAAVAANIQVALLQPLSYIRADYVIDAKYLTKAVGMKSDPELIKKYCGMAVWKSMGFYNLAINNGLAHKIMQDDSTKDKIIDKTLWLAGKMDELTWQKLWNACELEIKDKTDLKGEEFYKAVGERLTEVIFATQVVDSILTKSELMRGTDTYTKMLTAFNAEPTLGLNILMDAAEMFDQERRAHGTQSALRKHGATMKKAATVYLMGSLAESVLRAVWGRIRNYDGEDDDETLIHEIVTRFLEELNPLRKIPFVKDLYGILVQTISVFAGDQYKIYADTRMDEASIEALANAIVQVPKVIKKQEITYKDINKIAKGVDATGLPVSSTIRIFKGIWNNTIGRIWESALIK